MRTFRGNQTGFSLIELLVAIAIIGILVLIAVPHFLEMRHKSLDRVAQAVGFNANAAEELHYTMQPVSDSYWKKYTNNLNDLLVYDPNLTEHVHVTINFVGANQQGFTLYTQHANGTGQTFLFSNDMRYSQ